MSVAERVLAVALTYVLVGLAVGVPFVLRDVDRVDEAAAGAGLGFRLLILPGTVAFWPLLAVKWANARGAGGHP